MADFYYQIKGKQEQEEEPASDWGSRWVWPPIFSGLISAPDKKAAKALIEEEYGRQFPLRVLKKDIDEHAYLLHIRIVDESMDYIRSRFQQTACKECGAMFRLIDKYNDPHADHRGPEYCSAPCHSAGKFRDVQEFKLVAIGKVPAVIYRVQQKSTGMAYVGQTIQPFTLRWWQHLTTLTDCKFHEAMRKIPLTDWDFSVLEVIAVPEEVTDKAAFITERERHWIEAMDSVSNGFNTVRPKALVADSVEPN